MGTSNLLVVDIKLGQKPTNGQSRTSIDKNDLSLVDPSPSLTMTKAERDSKQSNLECALSDVRSSHVGFKMTN